MEFILGNEFFLPELLLMTSVLFLVMSFGELCIICLYKLLFALIMPLEARSCYKYNSRAPNGFYMSSTIFGTTKLCYNDA